MSKFISSPQNPLIKFVASLRQSKHRRANEKILIDGSRAILHALRAGWSLESIITLRFNSQAIEGANGDDRALFKALQNGDLKTQWIEVPEAVLMKMAYGQSKHSIAVADPPSCALTDLELSIDNSADLFVVLDQVEKPGNVGAVLRTANALGVKAVLLSDPICDVWNPNTIRASAGAIFATPIAIGTQAEITAWFEQRQITVLVARVEASVDFASVQVKYPAAIVLGNEAAGLLERWNQPTFTNIKIPTTGIVDSLNVSIAAAILIAGLRRIPNAID